MMMKRLGKLLVPGLILAGSVSASAAVKIFDGTCIERAWVFSAPTTVMKAQSFFVNREYYPDSGVYGDNYVAYFKVTLTRSRAYTFWIEDATSESVVIDSIDPIEATGDDEIEPAAMFTEYTGAWGCRWMMSEDEWYIDEDDPSMSDPESWTYVVKVTGQQGGYARLCYQQGNLLPKGIEDNPENLGSIATELVDGKWTGFRTFITNEYSYCFTASLIGGRRYLFATSGADAANTNRITFGSGKVTQYDAWQLADNEMSCSYDPDGDEDCVIKVYGANPELGAARFNLRYRRVPSRKITEHGYQTLTVGTRSDPFVPGRINATDNEYYDEIIDQKLFAFLATKGERYVLATAGADTNLLMRVYNTSGKIVAENSEDGTRTGNVRIGLTATYTGVYYVGVCQKLEDDDLDELTAGPVTLALDAVTPLLGDPDDWDFIDDDAVGATVLVPHPVKYADQPPNLADAEGNGPHRLSATDWYDCYAFVARKGQTYTFRASLTDSTLPPVTLVAKVFKLVGNSETGVTAFGDVNPGSETPLTFECTANGTYYIRLAVAEGYGLDYPEYRLHSAVCETSSGLGSSIGILTVDIKGCDSATWTLGSESFKYAGGTSVALPAGQYVVKFAAANGFTTPAQQTVKVAAGSSPTMVTGVYNDKSDPKDDYPSGRGMVAGKSVTYGATNWSVSNRESVQTRTLWKEDVADCFSISGKDGQYYDFALTQLGDADAVFSITNAEKGVMCRDVTEVSQLVLPTTKSKYILVVSHADPSQPGETAYSISGFYANVGSIKFGSTAVSAKDTATSVKLTVNRTARDGMVRVHYTTVDGTAREGEHYVGQSGILEWPANDNKARTIEIKLIPKLIAAYAGGNHSFTVRLEDAGGEYPASIVGGSVATVTLTESSRGDVTVESVYAKKAPKLATVKTETVGLETGTYYGVVDCGEDGAETGMERLGSVTFTCSTAAAPVLSGKASVGGKTYSFTTREKAWEESDDPGYDLRKTFVLTQTVNRVKVEQKLVVYVREGDTEVKGDWLKAAARAELIVNGVTYRGELFRQNAKIQDYLVAVTNFTGYFTAALVNPNGDEKLAPAGNGYVTLTVDNKGTVKVAGLLPDNTKISVSVTAAAIRGLGGSEYELVVPVFYARSPYCFGGVLRLRRLPIDGRNPDGTDYLTVIDSANSALVWNNDNAKLTYEGTDGWRLNLVPAGGWYDTVFNLQNYYRNRELCVETADVGEFPAEILQTGYSLVSTTSNDPNGYPLAFVGDTLATDKKTMVRNGQLNDLENSVNPFNVQVKLARATGIVTGSFSLWSQNGTAQKEITGIKHNGILVLQRDRSGTLADDVLAAGFFNQSVKVQRAIDGRSTRTWTLSKPFNIVFDEEEVE